MQGLPHAEQIAQALLGVAGLRLGAPGVRAIPGQAASRTSGGAARNVGRVHVELREHSPRVKDHDHQENCFGRVQRLRRTHLQGERDRLRRHGRRR